MPTTIDSLRAALEVMPSGTLVPRDWLLERLSNGRAANSGAVVDMTIPELARLFGKRPSTVRAWVERGDFAGAYKLHGKEWRIPAAAIAEFQSNQRHR